MMYKDSKVWLQTTSGVAGWDVDELNIRIDEYNSFHGPLKQISFSGCHGWRTTEMIIKAFRFCGIAY